MTTAIQTQSPVQETNGQGKEKKAGFEGNCLAKGIVVNLQRREALLKVEVEVEVEIG